MIGERIRKYFKLIHTLLKKQIILKRQGYSTVLYRYISDNWAYVSLNRPRAIITAINGTIYSLVSERYSRNDDQLIYVRCTRDQTEQVLVTQKRALSVSREKGLISTARVL